MTIAEIDITHPGALGDGDAGVVGVDRLRTSGLRSVR